MLFGLSYYLPTSDWTEEKSRYDLDEALDASMQWRRIPLSAVSSPWIGSSTLKTQQNDILEREKE